MTCWIGSIAPSHACEVDSDALRERLHAWFEHHGKRLGDGAVSVASLRLDDMPEPVIVNASHRTMLRRLSEGDPEPPAIAPIVEQLQRWSEGKRHGSYDGDHGD
jgi:hypothetical protein